MQRTLNVIILVILAVHSIRFSAATNPGEINTDTSGVEHGRQARAVFEPQARFYRDTPGSLNVAMSTPDFSGSIDTQTLIELGLNPFRFVLPNTVPALQADLSQNLMKAGAGLSSLQASMANMMPSFSPSTYQQMLINRYQNSEELLRRALAILSNPEQLCMRVANQAQSSMQVANNEVESLMEQASQAGDSLTKSASENANQMMSQAQQQAQQAAQSVFKFSPGNLFG